MVCLEDLELIPDLSSKLTRFNNDNPNQIIVDEERFIKKILANDCNINVLFSLCSLNLEGFNNHKDLFLDYDYEHIALVAPYLKEYKDTYKTILTMSLEEIITLFRIMLERLILAHQNGFNPYDLKYSNYLLDKDNQPVFTDFDFSFYKERCTSKFFSGKNFDFEKQDSLRDNLLINDKLEILKLFLHSISSSFDLDSFLKSGSHNLYDFLTYFYNNLKTKYVLPQEVDEYLSDLIFKKMLPKEDDYFIDHLINPLEKGLELKL